MKSSKQVQFSHKHYQTWWKPILGTFPILACCELYITQIGSWENSLFQYDLWQWKSCKIFKIKVCKWSSLYVWPRYPNPSVSSFFGGVRILFSQYWPSGGNKEWAPQYESEKVGNSSDQKWLNRLQMVQLECPRHPNPSVSSFSGVVRIFYNEMGELPFPIFAHDSRDFLSVLFSRIIVKFHIVIVWWLTCKDGIKSKAKCSMGESMFRSAPVKFKNLRSARGSNWVAFSPNSGGAGSSSFAASSASSGNTRTLVRSNAFREVGPRSL